MRDDVHRGDAVAQGPRPRTRHGPRGVRLARLETPRLTWLAPHPGPRSACGERVRVRGIVGLALVFSGIAGAADGASLDALVQAYPEQLAGYDSTDLIWRDGTRMPLSDGQTSKCF